MADREGPGERSNPLVAEHVGPYYVYLLSDPDTQEAFYVGKGAGDRFRAHGWEAHTLSDAASEEEAHAKVERIREIRKRGSEPRIEFARRCIATEDEAYLVEAALIDVLLRHGRGRLTNEVRGHGTDLGLVGLDELEMELAAPHLEDTSLRAILIKLGDWGPEDDPEVPRSGAGFRHGMSELELYDSMRAWWHINPERARNYPYAVPVYQGITRGVWTIDQKSWRRWDAARHGTQSTRWMFDAEPVREGPVYEAFHGRTGRRIGTRPSGGPVFGTGSPIAYWPV